MTASSSDMFTYVGSPGTATTLSAPGHTIGGTSFTVGSTTNWPTTSGVVFAVDTYTLVNGVAVRTVGSYTEWEATVSSSTGLANAVLRYGTDQNYAAGSTTRVYIPVASSRENRMVDGISISLDQDGTLKAGAVDNAGVLASDVVTSTKILQNAVQPDDLATNAITLGYAQSTANFVTSSTTAVQVTGLTITVTIPAGGRKVKITAFNVNMSNNTANRYCVMSVWDGVVGSGTQVSQAQTFTNATPGGGSGGVAIAVVTPSAGSKTYNVGFQTDGTGGTATMGASSVVPSFILVEAI